MVSSIINGKKIFLVFVLSILLNPIVKAQKTEFWGITRNGGKSKTGTIFKTNSDGRNYQEVYSFSDGKFPSKSLLHASDGNLYGVTENGGNNDDGILFKFNPSTKTFEKLYDFNNSGIGSYPNGNLLEINETFILGTTDYGGEYNHGVIYQFNPKTKEIKTIFEFKDTATGYAVQSELLLASNNKIFGLCNTGGTFGLGTLFEFNPENAEFIKKFDFKDDEQGSRPYFGLVEGVKGKLYGLTREGSPTNWGILFEYDFEANKYSFKRDLISNPYTNLLKTSDGKLYGFMVDDWLNNFGSIFEYDPSSDSFQNLHYLEEEVGVLLDCPFLEASNGQIYGLSAFPKDKTQGALFEFNISENKFTKKLSFNLEMGRPAYECKLTEIESCSPPSEFDLSVSVKNGILQSNDRDGAYQWLDCDKGHLPIIGATNQIFKPLENGTYAVKITKNNCSEISSCYGLTVGLENISDDQFSVSPNPTNGKFTISFKKPQKEINILITSVLGEKIDAHFYKNIQEIYTEIKGPHGFYWVTIRSRAGIKANFKVLKE